MITTHFQLCIFFKLTSRAALRCIAITHRRHDKSRRLLEELSRIKDYETFGEEFGRASTADWAQMQSDVVGEFKRSEEQE